MLGGRLNCLPEGSPDQTGAQAPLAMIILRRKDPDERTISKLQATDAVAKATMWKVVNDNALIENDPD